MNFSVRFHVQAGVSVGPCPVRFHVWKVSSNESKVMVTWDSHLLPQDGQNNCAIAVYVGCMYDLVISVRVLHLSHNNSMNYSWCIYC